MSTHDDERYQVGYKKPPRQYQYKKGESGNCGGRPKGALNVATILAQTLTKRIVITERGQRKTITLLEASLMQLGTKAAAGDFRFLALLLGQMPDVAKFLASQVAHRKTRQQKMHELTETVNRILGVTA